MFVFERVSLDEVCRMRQLLYKWAASGEKIEGIELPPVVDLEEEPKEKKPKQRRKQDPGKLLTLNDTVKVEGSNGGLFGYWKTAKNGKTRLVIKCTKHPPTITRRGARTSYIYEVSKNQTGKKKEPKKPKKTKQTKVVEFQ